MGVGTKNFQENYNKCKNNYNEHNTTKLMFKINIESIFYFFL